MSQDFTNTFVGNVRQGNLTNAVAGNNLLDLLGSMVPVGGDLNTNILVGWTAQNLDTILHWNVGLQDFDPALSQYRTRSNQGWTPNISINVGEGFFMRSSIAGPTNWVRNFTVQ